MNSIIPYGQCWNCVTGLLFTRTRVLAALFTERFMSHSQRLKKHGKVLQIIAGGLMIVMGIAMITGYLTDFSIWILKIFPLLGEPG